MHDWKKYETQILNTFRTKWPKADLQPDKKLMGKYSKVNRQVDIYVTGEIVGVSVTGAIECKHFNRKVDVSIVDAFVGFLEDIGAAFGIIITNNGFTKGAANRAAAKKIKIDIVAFKDIDTYVFDWDSCESCSTLGNHNHEIYWYHRGKFQATYAGKLYSLEEGHCSYCNATHIKCEECGGVFSVDDKYDQSIECYCGTLWIAQLGYVGSGMEEETFYIRKKQDIPLKYIG